MWGGGAGGGLAGGVAVGAVGAEVVDIEAVNLLASTSMVTGGLGELGGVVGLSGVGGMGTGGDGRCEHPGCWRDPVFAGHADFERRPRFCVVHRCVANGWPIVMRAVRTSTSV